MPASYEWAIPIDKALEPWAGQIQQWIKRDRLKLTRVQELLASAVAWYPIHPCATL
jgi:hypothetical protein